MRNLATVGTLCIAVAVPTSAIAQWSTELPGVPGPSIPTLGAVQKRFEFDLSGYRLSAGASDSTGARLRVGAGWSWRITPAVEIGFDFTVGEVSWLSPAAAADGAEPDDRLQVAGLYAPRIGLKLRPVSYLDLEGNGFELAIGAGYQPELAPVITHRIVGDSTVTGGLVGEVGENDELGKVHSALMLMAAVGYRTPRLTSNLAFVYESGDTDAPSAVRVPDRASVRAGVRYRLTHWVALAAAFWGGGAPPWRDRLNLAAPADEDIAFGVFLSFGGAPQQSFNLTWTTPTGSFGESGSLYIATR